jgi:exodeoxyribonuclease V alpha subunit
MITAAWEEQRAIKEVMVFLQGMGVSTSLAVRIYKNLPRRGGRGGAA